MKADGYDRYGACYARHGFHYDRHMLIAQNV